MSQYLYLQHSQTKAYFQHSFRLYGQVKLCDVKDITIISSLNVYVLLHCFDKYM